MNQNRFLSDYRDAGISRQLIDSIIKKSHKPVRLMEVCGTHTMSIFRHGIRNMLPETIALLSGPGCPVCVTSQGEIDAFIALSEIEDVIVTTFGDLMRVPGSKSSLQDRRAAGCDIRVVYSAFDAVQLARNNPDKKVVFLGVGFETTAPTVAATIFSAAQTGVDNFYVYSAHKLVPPALEALLASDRIEVDGLLLPGHVSVIIGTDAYRSVFETYRVPSVVAGFEPVDLLQAIDMLVDQIETNAPRLKNAYPRAVTAAGNIKAMQMLETVFSTCGASWRGIGSIDQSGLAVDEAYKGFDARRVFDVAVAEAPEPRGCACGEILTGVKFPPQCPLYKKRCTPAAPVGPCMVSSEGTCAAYYRYHDS